VMQYVLKEYIVMAAIEIPRAINHLGLLGVEISMV